MSQTMAPTVGAGALLRTWRERRRLSQLALASRAGVSTRHLSYVETGRSRPSDQMIRALSDELDIPLREQNRILLAGGFAPAHREQGWQSAPRSAVYQAVERILAGHMPYPAVVIDLSWDLVAANDAAYALFVGTPPWLLEPPVNVVRLCLHPQGLSDRIDNLDQWRAALLHRLRRELELTGDARLADLLAEVEQYDPPRTAQQGQVGQVGRVGQVAQVGEELVVPLHLRTDRGLLSLFGTTTVFGTPRDIAVSELAIEAFYPADDHTRAVLNQP